MTELLEREKKTAEVLVEETPPAGRVSRSRLFGVALAAVIFAAGVGWFAFNAVDGTDVSPAEAAEARAEAMVEVYESRWLEDPANIAVLRAQDMVEHYENLWRTQTGQ